MQTENNCNYCQSENIIKYGKYKDTQYYKCKDCGRRFASAGRIPKMQNSTKTVADALNMYYEGMSLNEIRRNFIQQDDNVISRVSAYNWVDRFTDLAVKEANQYQPKVGDRWIADETFIRIDKKKITDSNIVNPYSKSRKAKWIVFWDIIDADTRFLLASHVASTRGTADAKILMEKAAKRAGKLPKVVVTDSLRAYLDGIELAYGSDTKHKQGNPFEVENNTNLIERFHGTLKDRTKVMRALKNKDTLQKFMDGWLVHYNFFRPHMSLNDQTPAQAAGIKFPFRHWRDVVEQPYEITARIPVTPRPVRISRPKPRITKRVRITRRQPRISTGIISLRGMK